jgi:hypothetical protein
MQAWQPGGNLSTRTVDSSHLQLPYKPSNNIVVGLILCRRQGLFGIYDVVRFDTFWLEQ